ncbi:DNA translocase FtsK 4TM domain-containing protein [Diaphorobacter aerolatus]
MTYSLNTLNASAGGKSAPRSWAARFSHEIGLLIGLLVLVFWLLALVSYNGHDTAWSTSGAGMACRCATGWGGSGLDCRWQLLRAGLFGLVVHCRWREGLAVVAGLLDAWRRAGAVARGPWARRSMFWMGLLILLLSSTALEWTRLYRYDTFLPGQAGGMLGYTMGQFALNWLGDAGSGLICVILVVLGAAMVFGFSWAIWPSASAAASMAWYRAVAPSARRPRTRPKASARPASARKWCSRSAPRARKTIRSR